MKKDSTFFKIWFPLLILFISAGNLKAKGQHVIMANDGAEFPDSTVEILNEPQSGSIQLHDAVGVVNSTVDIDVEIIVEEAFIGFFYSILLPENFSYVVNSTVTDPPLVHPFMILPTYYPHISELHILGLSLLNSPYPTHITLTHTLNAPPQPGIYFPEIIDVLIGVPNPLIINGTITIHPDGTIVPGDANCDGTVNVQDIVAIVSYILENNPQPFCFDNADVNQDGQINVNDVVGTVNIILGGF